MAKFIHRKDNKLLNLASLQFIKIDPEDNTKLILYRINGYPLIEKYDTTSEAYDAYTTYKDAMTDLEGPKYRELRQRVSDLSDTVVEQQGEISDANTIAEDILDIISQE